MPGRCHRNHRHNFLAHRRQNRGTAGHVDMQQLQPQQQNPQVKVKAT